MSQNYELAWQTLNERKIVPSAAIRKTGISLILPSETKEQVHSEIAKLADCVRTRNTVRYYSFED